MKFSDNAMSAILLCSYIGINSNDMLKPLSLGEWNEFLNTVIEGKVEPGIVLNPNTEILRKMQFSVEYINRIQKLISRGGKAALELEDLSKKGIEVITCFDADYPTLIRRKLKRKAPPVLFYAGDIKLAKKIGIAVVGSRSVDYDGMEFTRRLVEKAAKEKLIIYSGGAKGVDTISEKTAINEGSAVVSFVADSLMARIKKKDVLESIIQGKLLLISDVKPDVGFSAFRAMNRNKYIYTSAYGAFVIASDYNKGGTWSGAIETIRNKWTKVLVWDHKEYDGNLKLIEKGAEPYALSKENIYDIIMKKKEYVVQLGLYDIENATMVCDKNEVYSVNYDKNNKMEDVYDYIKKFIVAHLENGMKVEEASQKFNVEKEQMEIWLNRLCKDELANFKDGVYKRA